MISGTISKQIAEAMKARNEIRLSTLRMLSSALTYEKIDKQHELSQEEEMEIVRREAKKRKDAIEVYEKHQNSKTPDSKIQERIDKETKELKILQEYLPKQMSDSELEKAVKEVISETGVSSMADVGKVMGMVMGKVKGRAEGGRVSEVVRRNLS